MSEDPSMAVLEEAPPPTRVDFRGESIEVKPLLLAKVPAFLRALQPMYPQLAGAYSALDAGQDGVVGALVVSLLAEHGERLYEAIGQAIDKSADWVADTDDMGGLVELATAIVAVNASFFVQQVVPRLAGLPMHLRTLTGAGRMLSGSSSMPASH